MTLKAGQTGVITKSSINHSVIKWLSVHTGSHCYLNTMTEKSIIKKEKFIKEASKTISLFFITWKRAMPFAFIYENAQFQGLTKADVKFIYDTYIECMKEDPILKTLL